MTYTTIGIHPDGKETIAEVSKDDIEIYLHQFLDNHPYSTLFIDGKCAYTTENNPTKLYFLATKASIQLENHIAN